MIRSAKFAVAALTACATALLPMTAEAGQRRHGQWPQQPFHAGQHWNGHNHHPRRNNDGALLAIGALGIIAGAMIASTAQPSYDEPVVDDGYYPPAPRSAGVIYAEGGYEPWSGQWYRYCKKRYRSFDAETGTFMGRDGRRHFCQAD